MSDIKYHFDQAAGRMHFTMPPGTAFKLSQAIETAAPAQGGMLCEETLNQFLLTLLEADAKHREYMKDMENSALKVSSDYGDPR